MTATVERPRAPSAAPRVLRPWPTLVLLTAATALWASSVARTDVDAIGPLGLLSAFPVTMYLALAVLSVSMAFALHRAERDALLAAHVVLFLVFVHGTPAMLYETLRYSWAWQHIGLTDFYARVHAVDPHVTNLNAYQSWPGFFATAATWLAGSHASSWIGPAQLAPLAFQLLDALALYAIFETLEVDHRVVWSGVWFFAIGNWIGQDYFSPQAFAFFCYLVVLLVVLRFAGRRPGMPRVVARLARRPAAAHAEPRQPARDPAPRRGAVVVAVVLVTAAIATSHPLTPVVLVVSVALLAVFRATTRPRLALVVGAVVVAWMCTGALGYMRSTLPSLLEGLVTLGGTVDQGLAKSANAGAHQHLVSLVGRAEVLVVIGAAAAGVVRRARHGRWDAVAIMLALAPAAILAGGAYGGEAVFRVYLFALPFLALLAAGGCYPSPARESRASSLLVLALTAAMLPGFLFGYFGKEEWAHFSISELHAAETVFVNARPGTLVVDGTADYPIGFANFEHVTYVHLSAEPRASIAEVLAAPEPLLYQWLADSRYAQGYLVVTKSQKAEADALGLLPAGALERIEQALLASARFTVVYHDADASVFTVERSRPGRVP